MFESSESSRGQHKFKIYKDPNIPAEHAILPWKHAAKTEMHLGLQWMPPPFYQLGQTCHYLHGSSSQYTVQTETE